jgi:hypothetical protein
MRRSHPNASLFATVFTMAVALGGAEGGETPTPTPTPRPAGGTSLSEVAKEKQLKKSADGKAIVISDDNLADYAAKGSVTATTTSTAKAGREPARDTAANPSLKVLGPTDPYHSDERQRYWVDRYQRQLERIASLKYQIALLDQEIPGLWRDFYAWDDPAYRDGVIKPRLDEALAQRERLQQELQEAEPRLAEIKNEARKDGAEPGWFRGLTEPTPLPATPTPKIVID